MRYTVKEAAKELRMSVTWMRTAINADKVNVTRLGAKIFIDTVEIDRIKKEGIKK